MPAWQIIRHPAAVQTEDIHSHIGGYPRLPPDLTLPTCTLCGSRMTFFFQIEFPNAHPWQGRVMAVFACTSCRDLDHGTPPLSSDLKHLPDGFLETYERNFRIFAFESAGAVLRSEYHPILRFERIELKALKSGSARVAKVGGTPNWRIANDFPEDYQGSRFAFLMQIWSGLDFEFEKLEHAPEQAQYPWMGDPFRSDGKYVLFSGLPLYFFGTLDLKRPRVYVLNQK